MWAAAALVVVVAAAAAAAAAAMILPAAAFSSQRQPYDHDCPAAESLVRNAVTLAASRDPTLLPALLRLHFHDCFVLGCDASVLLDVGGDGRRSMAAEKVAPPNRSLRGFEVIDAAKQEVERHCPNVVSCSDILAFAARDSVHLMGGPFWRVPGRRLDGFVSDASLVTANLPSPSSGVPELTRAFARHGLTQDDMVTLSGAHTIGAAHCTSFQNRLYNYSGGQNVADPTLPEQFVTELKSLCSPIPATGGARRRRRRRRQAPQQDPIVSLDTMTPQVFDNAYYANVELGQGLLQSDTALFLDSTTAAAVRRNAEAEAEWFQKFATAMAKMSSIGVKKEGEGEVRRDCRRRNAENSGG